MTDVVVLDKPGVQLMQCTLDGGASFTAQLDAAPVAVALVKLPGPLTGGTPTTITLAVASEGPLGATFEARVTEGVTLGEVTRTATGVEVTLTAGASAGPRATLSLLSHGVVLGTVELAIGTAGVTPQVPAPLPATTAVAQRDRRHVYCG